jgi:hypothetical protein
MRHDVYNVRYFVVPGNLSLQTITLHFCVRTTLVYNDTLCYNRVRLYTVGQYITLILYNKHIKWTCAVKKYFCINDDDDDKKCVSLKLRR